MGTKKSKFAEIPKHLVDVAVRRQQESDERKKLTYWAIRRSDERIAKTHEAIKRTASKLRLAGRLHEERRPQPEPDLVWDDLLVRGAGSPKRRRD